MFEVNSFDSDLSTRQLAAMAPAFLLIAIIVAGCLVDLWRGPSPRHLPRLVWTLVVLSSFPTGALAYLFLGRRPAEVAERPWGGPTDGVVRSETSDRAVFSAEAAALRTRGLVRDYGGTGVLGVDVAVPERGVYGLVGPNGSGKTTLLAMLAGLRRPGGGTIDYQVDPVRVTICPDVPRFEPWLTAREVVELARLATAGAGSDAGRTGQVLAEVGLADCADRRVGGFSRGMSQRLGLAVGLVGDPALLIMDEPTAALDPAGRVGLLSILERLGERIAVVLSSHDLSQIQRVATVVAVLHHGRLVYQGPTKDMIHLDPAGQDLEGAFLSLTGTEPVPCPT